MSDKIVQEFIILCMNNELDKAKEIYDPKIIDINTITYDTQTSDIQGPYNIFECMCIENNLEIVKWFIELGIHSVHYNNGFISACQYNNIEIVQYLNDHKKDIILGFQTSFLVACYQGYFELLKWLYTNANEHIDLHMHNETPFLYAIAEGHFEIAKWLYHISISDEKMIDIHADNDYAFIYACNNGRLDICKWLYLISNNTIDKRMQDNMPLKAAKLSYNDELILWLEK
jgi:ankyrin repeat protein